MTIIVNDRKLTVPGLVTVSYADPKSGFGPAIHRRPRTDWIRGIVVHTNRGMLPKKGVTPGGPDAKRDIALARYQADAERVAGWDYTVDFDGSVAVSNDPSHFATYHAGTVNSYTIGIEMCQGTNSPWTLYEKTLDGTVLLIDFLTAKFGIQRQLLCFDVDGSSESKIVWRTGPIPGRLQHPNDKKKNAKKDATGNDCCGIYGHRNVTANKGPGDPGSAIFDKLLKAGYEVFDCQKGDDLRVWKERQRKLNMDYGLSLSVDGIPGPATCQALKICENRPHGMYIPRPMDGQI